MSGLHFSIGLLKVFFFFLKKKDQLFCSGVLGIDIKSQISLRTLAKYYNRFITDVLFYN